MRNKKKQKSIDDVSVSQLLDEFLHPETSHSETAVQEIDDEEYIRMMLKKDVQRELERLRRTSKTPTKTPVETKKGILDRTIKERFFPDVSEGSAEEEAPAEDSIVTEILDSLVANDMPTLSAKMREAVNFVQDEMGVSESEKRLTDALNRYRKMVESGRVLPHISNDNVLVFKRCQNCYYSAGERTRRGVVWCLCENSDRTPDVETDGSWVKNSINLSCWTQSKE